MDFAPLITQLVCSERIKEKSFFLRPLKRRNRIVLAIDQKINRLTAKLYRMKPVELDGESASLSVSDFSGENCGICGFVLPARAEVIVAKPFAEQLFQFFSRTIEDNVSRWIVTFGCGP